MREAEKKERGMEKFEEIKGCKTEATPSSITLIICKAREVRLPH